MGRRLPLVARGGRRGRGTVRPALLAASRPAAHAVDARTGAVGGVRPIPLCGGRHGRTDRGMRRARGAVYLRGEAHRRYSPDARTRARDGTRLAGNTAGGT